MPIFGLTPDAARRTARAVRAVEDMAGGQGRDRDRPPPVHQGGVTAWARITSTSPTDGRYPGILRDYDPAAKTFSDLTDSDCWLVPPDGTAPELATEYLVRLQGEHTDKKLIWLIVAKGSPAASGGGVRIRELDGSPIYGPVPGITWDQATGLYVELDSYNEGSGFFGLIRAYAATPTQWGMVTDTDQVLGDGVKSFSSGVLGNVDRNAGSPLGISSPGDGDFAWYSASTQTVAPALYVNATTGQVWSGWPSGAFGGIGTYLVGITSCPHLLLGDDLTHGSGNNSVGLLGGLNQQTDSAYLVLYKGHPAGVKTIGNGAVQVTFDGNFGLFYARGAYALPSDLGDPTIGASENGSDGRIFRGGLFVGRSLIAPPPAGDGDFKEGGGTGGGGAILGGDPGNPEIQSLFGRPDPNSVALAREYTTTQFFTGTVTIPIPGSWDDTGIEVELDRPGRWILIGTLRGFLQMSSGTGKLKARVYNVTDSAVVTDSEVVVVGAGTAYVEGSAVLVRHLDIRKPTTLKVQVQQPVGASSGSLISDTDGRSTLDGFITAYEDQMDLVPIQAAIATANTNIDDPSAGTIGELAVGQANYSLSNFVIAIQPAEDFDLGTVNFFLNRNGTRTLIEQVEVDPRSASKPADRKHPQFIWQPHPRIVALTLTTDKLEVTISQSKKFKFTGTCVKQALSA